MPSMPSPHDRKCQPGIRLACAARQKVGALLRDHLHGMDAAHTDQKYLVHTTDRRRQ